METPREAPRRLHVESRRGDESEHPPEAEGCRWLLLVVVGA